MENEKRHGSIGVGKYQKIVSSPQFPKRDLDEDLPSIFIYRETRMKNEKLLSYLVSRGTAVLCQCAITSSFFFYFYHFVFFKLYTIFSFSFFNIFFFMLLFFLSLSSFFSCLFWYFTTLFIFIHLLFIIL